MRRDSPAQRTPLRSLWSFIFLAAVGALAYNLLSGGGSSGALAPLGQSMTFWVANAQADPESQLIAGQASGYWPASNDNATVGLLPGTTGQAISAFLQRTEAPSQAKGSLLVLTSTTLSDLATERSHARAAKASLVALLATDPLELAVPTHSPIKSISQVLAYVRSNPSRKLFALQSNPWLLGHLAAFVPGQNLAGHAPYRSYPTSGDALMAVENGNAGVVLATHSSLTGALRAHRLRLLPWKAETQPRAWVALAAPPGVSSTTLKALRRHAAKVVAGRDWQALLRRDGLSPVGPASEAPDGFLRSGVATAKHLARLSHRFIDSSS